MEKVFHHRGEEHREAEEEKMVAEVKEVESFLWLL